MKRNIALYHLLVFSMGTCIIAGYFFYRIKQLPPEAALAGIALLPIGVVYVIGFGCMCLLSLTLCVGVVSIKNYIKKQKG